MPKVFLSSTFLEMEEYRKAAYEAIDHYGYQCIRMETFPASDRAIADFCRARVAECDVFVLILGKFYGTPIPGRNISYTEDEFDAAVELKKPRLVFIPAPQAPTNLADALDSMEVNKLDYEEQKERQAKFKTKALEGILPRTFKSADDLKFHAGHSVEQYFKEAQIRELKGSFENPRVAPQKELGINLPNTRKHILARDGEARRLFDALSVDGPSIVSITAPPGFGKTSVFALAVRMALSGDAPEPAGIAVLDATAEAPGVASLANLLGRMTGLQEVAARFQSGAAEPEDARFRAPFFDFLRKAGKVWLVVENAQAVLAPTSMNGAAADFRELLKAWCNSDHQAKLLLLTRHALYPEPPCHQRLRDIEQALLGGLPEQAAMDLLRERLADTRFRRTGEPLLRQIVKELYRVPMALEQLAGYLRWNEQEVELNEQFVTKNDLLKLHGSEQMEDLLVRMIGETLKLLDASSLDLLRVLAWAGMPVPHSGLMALERPGAGLLTRLVRSNLLLAQEGSAAEGRSFDMHPLIREALAEPSGAGLDFPRMAEVFLRAGNSEWNQSQFRPALSLYVLMERAARRVGAPDRIAGAIMGRGLALWNLGHLGEAVAAYDESICIRRELVGKEGRKALRNDLANAIMNRGLALWNLGRLGEAVAAYDESIGIRRELVDKEGRKELRNDLARVIMNRGIVLANLGRLEEAVADYDESINIRRVLVDKENRQELRNELALAIMNRGVAIASLGRLEEAVTAYDESIAIYRPLVTEEIRQELRNDLARAIMNRGLALWNLGRLEKAVEAYDESIGIYRVLVDGESRQELRNDLARAITNRGLALANLGRLEESVAAYRESINTYRVLVEKEGRQELRNDLARAIMNRGAALWRLGRLEEAVIVYDESISIRRVLVEEEGRQELRNDLAMTLMNRGLALANLGRLEEAVTAYDESIDTYRVLVEREGRQELRNDLGRASMNRGLALWNLGRLEEAVAAYDESIDTYRVLVEREGRQELRNDLGRAIMNRGLALWNLGRLEEAVTAYDESIAIRRELVDKEGRQELRNDLALSIMNRGLALWSLGRSEEAVTAYDESIETYRALVERESRQELRNDLARTIMNRGLALANLGRLDEAMGAYDESIRIRRGLVNKESRRELRNDLALAITNRGTALANLGRLEEAVAVHRESINTYRVLVEKEGRQELRNDMARALYNLAFAQEKQGSPAALEAAREARKLREDLVREGMTYLERDLESAKQLEARLMGRFGQSGSASGSGT